MRIAFASLAYETGRTEMRLRVAWAGVNVATPARVSP